MDQYPPNTFHISSGTIFKTILIGLLFYMAYLLKGLLLIVLLAIVIASAVEMLTKGLTRRGVPRLLSVILIYLCIGVIIVCTVYFILLPLLSESAQVIKTLPSYLSSESTQTSDFISNQPFVSSLSSTFNLQDIVNQIYWVI